MTIEKIISILDQPENKHIHRIYYSSEGWCYIKSEKIYDRIKLSVDMPDDYILRAINRAK